jgi:biotin carboxylase
LGLPHQNIGGLENAFYKDTVRSILADHHIRQPAYCVIELDKAPVTAPLAFPFIIKPARDSGAAGVFLCRSPEDYHQALKAYHTHTRTFAGLQRTRILLEEFIEGDFYGAELLWHEDHWKVIGINKIFVDPSKSLCMTGIAHPADIHLNHLATIEKTIVHWVNLIGLEGGVINIEFKLVDNVPILIEINLRLAGALINEQVKHTTGISLVEQVINQACGLKTELRLTSTRCYTADAFVFFNKPGEILNEIDRSSIDSTHLISFTHVPLPFEALPSRELYFSMIVGHILASGVSCEDAMRNAENMVAQLQLKSTKMYDNEAICRS